MSSRWPPPGADLPPAVELVRTTPTFDEHTVPDGLLAAHRVATGVWGRLVVLSGEVDFTFDDDPAGTRRIAAGGAQVIPPDTPHHVSLVGPVRFAVEFHRAPTA